MLFPAITPSTGVVSTLALWDPTKLGGSVALADTNHTISDAVNETANGRSDVGVAFNKNKKYYSEFIVNTVGAAHFIGVSNSTLVLTTAITSQAVAYVISLVTGNKINGDGAGTAYGSAFTATDILMMAVETAVSGPDNDKIWWGKNGTWFNSGDPAAGNGPAFALSLSTTEYLAWGNEGSATPSLTIVEPASFTYAAPSGFLRGFGV